MKTGYVAILDALGFKGIWRSVPSDQVLTKLRNLVDRTEQELANQRPKRPFISFFIGDGHSLDVWNQTLFLSDTIFVGTSFQIQPVAPVSLAASTDDKAGQHTIKTLIDLVQAEVWSLITAIHLKTVARLLEFGTAEEPALAYRGCIAAGEFDTADSFLVGPAVDEAAELSQLADGAFVWLAPSAANRYQEVSDEPAYAQELSDAISSKYPVGRTIVEGAHERGGWYDPRVVHYAVPIKSAGQRLCPVVNPFPLIPPIRRAEVQSKILASFDRSSDSDVVRKKLHTAQFFERALQEARQ